MNPHEKVTGMIEMARVPAYYAPAYSQNDEPAEETKVALSQYLWILQALPLAGLVASCWLPCWAHY